MRLIVTIGSEVWAEAIVAFLPCAMEHSQIWSVRNINVQEIRNS